MNFPDKITVTAQEIDLSNASDTQKKYYFNFAEKIKEIYRRSNKDRCIISISGTSGSGKSVLSVIANELLKNEKEFEFYALDLDAFHFPNSYLEENELNKVKGRFDTYDVKRLYEMLVDFSNGKSTTFPTYSRITHEPDSNGPKVQSKKSVLLIAGLWLQRNDEKWNQVRSLVDYSFTINGSEEQARKNTINRHMAGGRSREEAEKFFETSDQINNAEIKNNSVSADEILPYFEDIS